MRSRCVKLLREENEGVPITHRGMFESEQDRTENIQWETDTSIQNIPRFFALDVSTLITITDNKSVVLTVRMHATDTWKPKASTLSRKPIVKFSLDFRFNLRDEKYW